MSKVYLPGKAAAVIAKKANIRAADNVGVIVNPGDNPENVVVIQDDGTGFIKAVIRMDVQINPHRPAAKNIAADEPGEIMVFLDDFEELAGLEHAAIIDNYKFDETSNQFVLK